MRNDKGGTVAGIDPRVTELIQQSNERLAQRDFAGGRARLEDAHRLAPDNALVTSLLANALSAQNRHGDAARLLERHLAKFPREPQLLTQLAEAQLKLGRTKAAEKSLESALAISPENLGALRLLTRIAFDQRRWNFAASMARRVIALAPRDVAAHILLARALVSAEDLLSARDALENLLEIDPSHQAMRDLLVEVSGRIEKDEAQRARDSEAAFADFLRAAVASNRVPAAEWRVAWMEFRRLFSELVQGPVWGARPKTREEWLRSAVSRERFGRVSAALGGLLPLEGLPKSLPLADAFELLEGIHDCIVNGLMANLPSFRRAELATARAEPAPLPGDYPRRAEVQALCVALQAAPPQIEATLLHGSLADGLVAGTYSDADVLCVIARPTGEPGAFFAAAKWLFDLNHELYAINPCMHHGPMIAFAAEFEAGAEAFVPSAVVRNGVWCKGRIDAAHYHDGLIEAVATIGSFAFYFERTHVFVPQIRSAFDVLWWTSNFLFLPLGVYQLETGSSIYKRECLSGRRANLSAEEWAIVDRVSEVRLALGQWMAARMGDPIPPIDRTRNAGLVLHEHRDVWRLAPAEVRKLGIEDDLACAVRGLWQRVRDTTLEFAYRQIGQEFGRAALRRRLPFTLGGNPRRLSLADYDRAREAFLERCREQPEVCAVFEFGEVACPGLSDLDFCVVLTDDTRGLPKDLQVAAFPDELAYVIDHDPLFVARSNVELLGALFPIFQVRQLWGEAMELPLTSAFPADVVRAAMTMKLLRKYPGDLDYFLNLPELDVRSILAVAHSFCHVRRCFSTLGVPVPPAVDEVAEFDTAVRSAFRSGRLPGEDDVWRAIDLSLAAAKPIRAALARYWGEISRGWPENRNALIPAGTDPASWVAEQLTDPLCHGARDGAPRLVRGLADYLEIRRRFSLLERSRERTPSPYIEPFTKTANDLPGLIISLETGDHQPRHDCWLLAKTDALGDQIMVSGLVQEIADYLRDVPAGRLVWIVREGIEAIADLLHGVRVHRVNSRVDPRLEVQRLRAELEAPVDGVLPRVFILPAAIRPYPASEAKGQLDVAAWWAEFVRELAPACAIAGSPNVNWFDQVIVRSSRAPRRIGIQGSPDSPSLPGEIEVRCAGELFTEPLEFRSGRKEFEHLRSIGVALLGREVTGPRLSPPSVSDVDPTGLLVAVGAGDRRRALPASTVAAAVAGFLASEAGRELGPCRVLEGPSDRMEALEVMAALRAAGVEVRLVRCGGRELANVAAWVRQSRLVLCNETSIAHLALALNVPTVVAWGLGHWPRFVPLRGSATLVRAELECTGCNWFCRYPKWRCVDEVSADDVVAALQERAAAGADGVMREAIVKLS